MIRALLFSALLAFAVGTHAACFNDPGLLIFDIPAIDYSPGAVSEAPPNQSTDTGLTTNHYTSTYNTDLIGYTGSGGPAFGNDYSGCLADTGSMASNYDPTGPRRHTRGSSPGGFTDPGSVG